MLAACTGGGSSSDTSTTEDAATVEPEVGGVLRLGIAHLASLDPADVSSDSPSSSITADLLFDGLTRVARGAREASPALASQWTTPDGGVTWQFTVRADATFASGAPITAPDAEASLERVASRLGPGLVADIRSLDAATLEIVLTRPMAGLPEALAAPVFGILAVGAPDLGAAGSGPFRLAGVQGDVVTLVRGGPDALLDGIELRQFDDLGAAYDAFEAGQLDWSLLPAERAEAAAESYGADGFVPFQSELLLSFNLGDPVFADVRFRRAIVTAIDRRAVVSAVYFGFADPLGALVPTGVPGSDPARCGAGCAYDPEVSRSLLAEVFGAAGLPVPEVVLDHEDSADETALAQVVAQQLEAVGIPVVLRPHGAEEYAGFVSGGGGGIVHLGVVGAAATPEAYLDPTFRTGGQARFSDPAVDLLLSAAARAFPVAERDRLLAEAESTILAAAAVVPVAQFRVLSVAAPAVEDLDLAVDGTFDPVAVWLDR